MSAPLVISAPVTGVIGMPLLMQDCQSSSSNNYVLPDNYTNSFEAADHVPAYARWQASLENLLLDRDGVQLFRTFLEGESFAHLLDFYFATDGFPKQFAKKDAASLRQLARQIYTAFLRGERCIRLRNETRAALAEKLRDDQPARDLFEAAKKETIEFLREAHRAFLRSDVFLSFVRDGAFAALQRDDSDSSSTASGTPDTGSQTASGSASGGAGQSQNGSVRASAYLPALPENVEELLANAARENRIEELHEQQLQLLQSLEQDAVAELTMTPDTAAPPAALNPHCTNTLTSTSVPVSVDSRDSAVAVQQLIMLASGAAQPCVSASAAAALKLNKENLRKTQLTRAAELSSAVYGQTHTNAVFGNRKPSNPYYTSYATVSTQDSELQSQSSDAVNDDGSLLGDSNAEAHAAHKRHKMQQLQHYLRRNILPHRDNLQMLRVVPAQVDAAERELATKHPEVFAKRLSARLQVVLDEQLKAERMSNIMNDPNSPANLTANLQLDDAACAFAAFGGRRIRTVDSPGRAPNDAISRLASLTNKLTMDSEHQDAQSILEEHCSRVWDRSNELTPLRAPSPPASHRPASNRQSASSSTRAFPTRSAFPHPFSQLPSSLTASSYEHSVPHGPYSLSSYSAYYHASTSKSDTGCSDLSDAAAVAPTPGNPLRPLSGSASTGSVAGNSHVTCVSGSASSGIVSDFSLPTTNASNRSHRKTQSQLPGRRQNAFGNSSSNNTSNSNSNSGNYSQTCNSTLQQFVAQQSQNGRIDMPRQPFLCNPLMPPVPQPDAATQIAEVARRLANSVNRSDAHDERSRSSSASRVAHLQTLARLNGCEQQLSIASQPFNLAVLGNAQVGGSYSAQLQALMSAEGTQVIYYMPTEEVPYRTTLPLRNVTLAQFRAAVIAKRDVVRCFFKKVCSDVEAGAVFEEIALDDAVLPLFEGKIVAKLQRVD